MLLVAFLLVEGNIQKNQKLAPRRGRPRPPDRGRRARKQNANEQGRQKRERAGLTPCRPALTQRNLSKRGASRQPTAMPAQSERGLVASRATRADRTDDRSHRPLELDLQHGRAALPGSHMQPVGDVGPNASRTHIKPTHRDGQSRNWQFGRAQRVSGSLQEARRFADWHRNLVPHDALS